MDEQSSPEQERASENGSSKSSEDTKSLDGSSSTPPNMNIAGQETNLEAKNKSAKPTGHGNMNNTKIEQNYNYIKQCQ